MIVKGKKSDYEVFLEMIQFEITGRCNMKCRHCRAWQDPQEDMTLETVQKVLDFAVSEACSEMRFTISGGEPLLHPKLFEILEMISKKVDSVKGKEIDHTVITTNGLLLNEKLIKKLEQTSLGELFIQISIDGHTEEIHDNFRNTSGAFKQAMKALELLKKSKLTTSVRATMTPETVADAEEIIKLARKYNVSRVSLGPTIPTGKAKFDNSLLLNQERKKRFLEELVSFKEKYPDMRISTEDPIKFSVCTDKWDYGKFDSSANDFLGGCSAGVTNTNVLPDGTMTPCSMLLTPIVKVGKKTAKEIQKEYESSEVIRNLVERNLKGKCNGCDLERLCGGCRAAADGMVGDYLAEDPTCWKC